MSQVLDHDQQPQPTPEGPPPAAPPAQSSASVPQPPQDGILATEQAADTSSRLQRLNGAERYWTWKAGIRTVICVLNIVGIGCTGWLISAAISLNKLNNYSWSDSVGWQAGIITILCVSFIWCFLSILIPYLLKPTRPLHPGIAVGIDLVLWLGFLLLGLLTLALVFDSALFGSDGYISDPTQMYSYSSSSRYNGEYYLAPNGTWIYNVTSNYNNVGHYNYTTGVWEYPDPTTNTSSVVRDCAPLFTTCAEQDAYVNKIWQQRRQRLATSILIDVVAWLNLLLHFAVFVWACVDTHRSRTRLRRPKEQIIADRIIADLESKGLISVQDGVVRPIHPSRPGMVSSTPAASGAL